MRPPPETPTPPPPERKLCLDNSPNKLAEELLRLAVTIFHKLSRTTTSPELEPARLNISCIGSRSLVPRAAATAAAMSMSPLKGRGSSRTTAAAPKQEVAVGTGGSRRRFVEFTRSSVDVSRVSLCLVDIKNLRSGLIRLLLTESRRDFELCLIEFVV